MPLTFTKDCRMECNIIYINIIVSNILFTIISRMTTCRKNVIVTGSSNVSRLITVVTTYRERVVSTKKEGWLVVLQYLHSVRSLSAKITEIYLVRFSHTSTFVSILIHLQCLYLLYPLVCIRTRLSFDYTEAFG